MKQLTQYFQLVHEIYAYFQYSGGDQILPLEDYTSFYWRLLTLPVMNADSYCPGNLVFHDEPVTDEYDFDFSEGVEAVYEGREYTMFHLILANGTESLAIFTNAKQT